MVVKSNGYDYYFRFFLVLCEDHNRLKMLLVEVVKELL